MSPKLRDLLVALPARQLSLIVGGAVVIVLLLAWTLALRFALGRIVTQATGASRPNDANLGNPAAWLTPLQYTLTNGALVETAPDGKTVRSAVLATGVRAFDLRVPDVGAGRHVLRIDLVLDRPDCDASGGQDCSIAYARTVRLGAAP